MSAPAMMFHLALDRLSRRSCARVPEPELVMSDPAHSEAFLEAGARDGILSFLYLFHAIQITTVIGPGDAVVDLGCGPGNQLAHIVRLNPHCRFIGTDASEAMLMQARTNPALQAAGAVEFVLDDITRLRNMADQSVDALVCTMTLHHLPDAGALEAAVDQMGRVLKPRGAVYISDFGRLRRARTQEFFAQVWKRSQSNAFTEDYRQSLRAAFSVEELQAAAGRLRQPLERHVTPLAPFMVVFKTPRRRELDALAARLALEAFAALEPGQKRKFRAYARWMRMAGCPLPISLG
jgi:arsenite methyltransferase